MVPSPIEHAIVRLADALEHVAEAIDRSTAEKIATIERMTREMKEAMHDEDDKDYE